MTPMSRRDVSWGLSALMLAALGRAGPAFAAGTIKPDVASPLIVTDVQNCFLPGGSLAVKDGDQVVPVINRIAKNFANVVMTQDWHTAGHVSFASSHSGKKPFEVIDLSYGKQVLWPDHCVQDTAGAAFHPGLSVPRAELIVRKGYHADIDSYSAFYENDRKTTTGLEGYLRDRGIRKVVLAGLATDFCVAYSVIDACQHGFDVTVLLEACRAIDLNGSLDAMILQMKEAGANIL